RDVREGGLRYWRGPDRPHLIAVLGPRREPRVAAARGVRSRGREQGERPARTGGRAPDLEAVLVRGIVGPRKTCRRRGGGGRDEIRGCAGRRRRLCRRTGAWGERGGWSVAGTKRTDFVAVLGHRREVAVLGGRRVGPDGREQRVGAQSAGRRAPHLE